MAEAMRRRPPLSSLTLTLPGEDEEEEELALAIPILCAFSLSAASPPPRRSPPVADDPRTRCCPFFFRPPGRAEDGGGARRAVARGGDHGRIRGPRQGGQRDERAQQQVHPWSHGETSTEMGAMGKLLLTRKKGKKTSLFMSLSSSHGADFLFWSPCCRFTSSAIPDGNSHPSESPSPDALPADPRHSRFKELTSRLAAARDRSKVTTTNHPCLLRRS